MTLNLRKYELGFSAGALLSEAFNVILSNCNSIEDIINGYETIDYNLIPVNSESSKKRYLFEILKRIKTVPLPILERYLESNSEGQRIIEFFAICNCYSIITEFMIEVLRAKWLKMDFELEFYNVNVFLQMKLSDSNQENAISEKTMYKLSQVILKMLKELGMYDGQKFCKLNLNYSILRLIVRTGNQWFLDVLLLTDIEKNELMDL